MKELNEVVTSTISRLIESGEIDKMISENVEETVRASVKSALREYGSFGEAVKEHIKEAIQFDHRDVSMPIYNQFIGDIIRDKFTKVLQEDAAKHLSEIVEGIIEPVTKDAKMSDFIRLVESTWGDVARSEGNEEIEIEAEYNDDDTAVYVKIKHPEWDHECIRVTFYNFNRDGSNAWHIGYLNEDGKNLTTRTVDLAGSCINEITSALFKYYAMGTVFEMDCEIGSIYVGY
jgi:hypothetical protein